MKNYPNSGSNTSRETGEVTVTMKKLVAIFSEHRDMFKSDDGTALKVYAQTVMNGLRKKEVAK